MEGKPDEIGGNPDRVPLCPHQTSHHTDWDRNRASTRKVRRLNTWARLLKTGITISCT